MWGHFAIDHLIAVLGSATCVENLSQDLKDL